MHWFKNHAFGSHVVVWLAFAVIVVLTIAVRIGGRGFFMWLLARKPNAGKVEREYWRIHDGE